MKKMIWKFLPVLFVFVFASSYISGQVSGTKKVGGTEYYIYKVQAGEGLYAISKRFGVSQADINNINPQIHNGLRAGEEILIPATAKQILNSDNQRTESSGSVVTTPVAAKKYEPQAEPQTESVSFIEHQVQKKQTLFGICKKYGITQDDLQKYNPAIASGLKDGMVLKIPVKNTASSAVKENEAVKNEVVRNEVKAEKDDQKEIRKPKASDVKNEIISITDTNYIVHKVKKKETAYSISKIYGVTVEDIVSQNPGADEKLKVGSELRFRRKVQEQPQVIAETPKAVVSSENQTYNTRLRNKVKPNKEPVRIAFLLPFMLDNSKPDASNNKFSDFYAGALIAVNEAKNLGVSFEIFSYDTEKSEEKIVEVLNNNNLRNADLIIGPAYTNQITYVTDFARENRINTLIPFSSKVLDLSVNPYVFQFNPSENTQENFIAELLSDKLSDNKVIFLNLPDVNFGDEGNDLANNIKRKLTSANISYKDIDLNGVSDIASQSILNTSGKKIIFLNTDKFSLAAKYLDAINNLPQASDLIVFTQFSWQLSTRYSFKTCSVSPFRQYVNDAELSEFEVQYSKYFSLTPGQKSPRYDLLGYDLTSYFIAQIYSNGTNFGNNELKLPVGAGIQSVLKFERNSERNGFMNKQLYLHVSE
ncbi:MAG: Peptidoglycan-binding lysin domain [Bacteroidetes bacterium]|nr:Peptidoglycan-binding lysin domain [Bacteroidota bacterium]